MVTVNEHLPEDHRDHITNFNDVRDEAHVPPGNSSEGPAPTQDELLAANEAVEAARGTVVGDASVTKGDEDLLIKPHQGASSWYSDPDAMSSDLTQRVSPGYETAEVEAEPEAEPESDEVEEYDPSSHTVADVEAYAAAHPDEIGDILASEQEGQNRSTLVSKLETMKVS